MLEALVPKARPFIPSAMGLGLAWVMPFSNAFAFAIGALLTQIWKWIRPSNAETFNIPVASGLIAGESLIAALVAILCTIAGFVALKH